MGTPCFGLAGGMLLRRLGMWPRFCEGVTGLLQNALQDAAAVLGRLAAGLLGVLLRHLCHLIVKCRGVLEHRLEGNKEGSPKGMGPRSW